MSYVVRCVDGQVYFSKLSFSIRPRSSCISVFLEQSNPALVGENYDATLVVVNQENTPITDLDIRISLLESLDETQPHGECK